MRRASYLVEILPLARLRVVVAVAVCVDHLVARAGRHCMMDWGERVIAQRVAVAVRCMA